MIRCGVTGDRDSLGVAVGVRHGTGNTVRSDRRGLRPSSRQAWAFLLAVAALLAMAGSRLGPATRTQVTGARHGLAAVPAAAQGAVARALGRADQRFYVRRATGGLTAVSGPGGVNSRFTRRGPVVDAGGTSWAFGLLAFGRGASLTGIVPAAPSADHNVVRYARPSLQEWYANGPLGLEQGFTLRSRPAGNAGQPLTLLLGELPQGLHATISDDRRSALVERAGRVLLRYSGLLASDARGRPLAAWIESSGRMLSLRVDDHRAAYPLHIDPFIQEAKLTASDAALHDWLGSSVAISGDTVVVGAPGKGTGNNVYEGAAYVFVKPASGWASATETAKLSPSDGMYDWEFGASVAISGNTIAVGAPETSGGFENGAVYVYTNSGSGWGSASVVKLTASDGKNQDGLGAPLAMSGDTIVAGNSRGALYVFTKPAGGWVSGNETAKLTTSDNQALGSVAIDGNTIASGAPNATHINNFSQGAVYVFTNTGGGWGNASQDKLLASDGATNDNLGISVGISQGINGQTIRDRRRPRQAGCGVRVHQYRRRLGERQSGQADRLRRRRQRQPRFLGGDQRR
jgi:hypothetical protein